MAGLKPRSPRVSDVSSLSGTPDVSSPRRASGAVRPAVKSNNGSDRRAENAYNIIRVESFTPRGAPANLWLASVKRQGKLFSRNFHDGMYGGTESARAMAVAYRDALLRLFPPCTQLDLRVRTRANNKSGVAGVMAKREKGRLKGWLATLEVSGVIHRRYFSVKEFGDEEAKALAISARQELLTFVAPQGNSFALVSADATQYAQATFPELLQSGQQGIDSARLDEVTMARRHSLLNDWFDAMEPQFIHLRLSVYPIAKQSYSSLFVVVGSGKAPRQLQRKSWTMQLRTYQDVLLLAWDYVQEVLTERFGAARWQEFERLYAATVFASTPDAPMFIRHRLDPPEGTPLCNSPPHELANLLAGLSIPRLPPQDCSVR